MADRTVTFHALAAANRRRSRILMAAVVLVLAGLGAAIGTALALGYAADPLETALIGAGVAAGVGVVSSMAALHSGNQLVFAAAGATEASGPEYRQLRNVVAEMALAAGLPAPRVFVIDDPGLNAFATGPDPERAAVAITTGLLNSLDREELQGVIAHELSHIRHLDIRFSLVLAALVGAVAIVAEIGLRSVLHGGRRARGRSAWPLLIVALALAIVAPLLVRLVQLAASRQRELLADAGAVDLTRNPAGLEQALSKIGAAPSLQRGSSAINHLFIADPSKRALRLGGNDLLATHPPLIERINRLRALRQAPPLPEPEFVPREPSNPAALAVVLGALLAATAGLLVYVWIVTG